MGLDLWHVVPSAKTASTLEFFVKHDFHKNLAFWNRYSYLFEEEDNLDSDTGIIIFPDKKTMEVAFEDGAASIYRDIPFLIGNVNDLQQKIDEITIAIGRQNDEIFLLEHIDQLYTTPDKKNIVYHTVEYLEKKEKIKVLYYIEKGYRRKGVSPQFYNDFVNCKLYFTQADVIKASAYILPKSNKPELFKTNFIDNFIEGESIFFASW